MAVPKIWSRLTAKNSGASPGCPPFASADEKGGEAANDQPTELEALILGAGLFDQAFYLAQIKDGPPVGPALRHYLAIGESLGLKPSAAFSPVDYILANPEVGLSHQGALEHFARFGRHESRALHPLANSESTLSAEEATKLAYMTKAIRESRLFDEPYYAALAEADLQGDELIRHYLTVGEKAGLAPSTKFSPSFYLGANPEIAESRLSPLFHFVQFGKAEGRRAFMDFSVDDLLAALDPARETVLVVVHETSMTGAPILGLNICQQLKAIYGYNVVALAWNAHGPLRSSFDYACDFLICPDSDRHFETPELIEIFRQVGHSVRVKYTIANSSVVNKLAMLAVRAGIPTIGLVHEFASLIENTAAVSDYLQNVHELVFPAAVVRDSVIRDNPHVAKRDTHVIAQGKSSLDGPGPGLRRRDRPLGSDYLAPSVVRWGRPKDGFIVAGLGTIEWRKGIDVFVATARALRKHRPDLLARFVWIGGYYAGSYESALYIEEQILRSGLEDSVIVLPETSRIEEIYSLIDVLLITPRLDPFPNVAIDAMTHGVPLVVCDGGTGVSEAIATDSVLAQLIVPYMDSDAAASVLARLFGDRDLLARCGESARTFAGDNFSMRDYVMKIDAIMSTHIAG